MLSERARSQRDSPGRIEKWECATSIQTCGEAMEHASLWIEHIYQAVSPTRHVVVLLRVLLGERHEDHPAHGLNIKGAISNRCMWVRKLAEQRDICAIRPVCINRRFRKVSGQQHRRVAGSRKCDALVNCSTARRQYLCVSAEGIAP